MMSDIAQRSQSWLSQFNEGEDQFQEYQKTLRGQLTYRLGPVIDFVLLRPSPFQLPSTLCLCGG